MNLPDGLHIMQLDFGNIEWLWNNLNRFESLFSDFTRGDFQNFMNRISSHDTVLFKFHDVAYVLIDNIRPGVSCGFHGASFDSNLRGKEEKTREFLEYLFDTFDLRRIETRTPAFAKFTMNFLKRVGFKREGVVRKCAKYKGKWIDMHLFGILKEELENGK